MIVSTQLARVLTYELIIIKVGQEINSKMEKF